MGTSPRLTIMTQRKDDKIPSYRRKREEQPTNEEVTKRLKTLNNK